MSVFVVHPVRDNIASATKFGAFRFITKGYVFGDELEAERQTMEGVVSWTLPDGVREVLSKAVLDFSPDEDYLLIAGDHLQLLAFTVMLGELHESFFVLRYDRKINDYIPVRLHAGLAPGVEAVLNSPSNIGDTGGKTGDQGCEARD